MNFLIPKNVKARFEFFPGFGFFELGLVLAGIAIGGVLFGIVNLITKSPMSIICFVLGGSAGFFLGKRDPKIGFSVLQLFQLWRRFQTKQKRYLYKHGER